MPPVTLLELARRLRVSKSSISVSLRGLPGVSKAVRRRVLLAATRLGYQPDPVASELMAMVRGRRRGPAATTLAFVNTFREPELFRRYAGIRAFLEGARAQAERYGYGLEMFQAWGGGMTPARLERILRSRGIRGLLLGPRWMDEPELKFDYGGFSCVVVGEATYRFGLNRVCNHHVHACALALREMHRLGYRRIGVKLVLGYESTRGFDYLLGIEEAKRELAGRVHFSVRLGPVATRAELVRWVRRCRLEALLSLEALHADVRGLTVRGGRPLGYANLDLMSESAAWNGAEYTGEISGIDQHTTEIGGAAVDLLRSLLHAGERGTTLRPRIVLIEGAWRGGRSTAGRPAE